ncbi:MAG: tetratricopeptide repeat protein [Candidatus Kariarchaeaceae archaeon]|jgi:tetratricopeptide (TPR) repeat protein
MDHLQLGVLIKRGEIDQAYDLFGELEEPITEDTKLLMIEVMKRKGLFVEALSMINELLSTCKSDVNRTREFKALVIKSDIIWRQGELVEAEKLITNADFLLHNMIEIEVEDTLIWQGRLFNVKGAIHWTRGELDESLLFFEKSLNIRKELGDEIEIAAIYNNIGLVYFNKGNYELALEYNNKSLSIRQEVGHKQDIATSFNNIGVIYHEQGELDQALFYHQKSLSIKMQINNKQQVAYSLNNLGMIYSARGEYDSAIDNLSKSLTIKCQLGNNYEITNTLYYLAKVYLDMGDLDRAHEYAQQIYNISETMDSDLIEHRSKMIQALILKNSKRIKDQVNAQQLLQSIVNDKIYNFGISIKAIVHLADLLLTELKLYGEQEVLDEIVKLSHKIYKTAQDQKSYALIIDALILQSKLALLQDNIELSKLLLEQASITANEYNMIKQIYKISFEQSRLENELSKWFELIKNNADMVQKIEYANLQDYLNDVSKIIKN